jgi:hypothetical protein
VATTLRALTEWLSRDCGPSVVGWIVRLAHSLGAAPAERLAQRLAEQPPVAERRAERPAERPAERLLGAYLYSPRPGSAALLPVSGARPLSAVLRLATLRLLAPRSSALRQASSPVAGRRRLG